MFQILSAIRARKRSILSNMEWKAIPWSHIKKTPRDRLLDVLVEIPTLMEESDILNSYDEPGKKDHHRKKLIGKCWFYDKQLREWYKKVSPDNVLRPFNTEESTLIDPMDLASAYLMTLYWTTCILLYDVMHAIVCPSTQLPERASIKPYCQKIFRTVPIFFHPAVGTYRTHLATFPLSLAILHLSAFEPEERILEQRFLEEYFQRPEGMALGNFLRSLELEYSGTFGLETTTTKV
jgi:hypothetical protein